MAWTREQLADKLKDFGLDPEKAAEALEEMAAEFNHLETGRDTFRTKARKLEAKLKKVPTPAEIKAAAESEEVDPEAFDGLAAEIKGGKAAQKRLRELETTLKVVTDRLAKADAAEEQRRVRKLLEPHVAKHVPREDLRPRVIKELESRVKKTDGGYVPVGADGEPIYDDTTGNTWTLEQLVADLRTGERTGLDPFPSAFEADSGKESPRGHVEPIVGGGVGGGLHTYTREQADAAHSRLYGTT